MFREMPMLLFSASLSHFSSASKIQPLHLPSPFCHPPRASEQPISATENGTRIGTGTLVRPRPSLRFTPQRPAVIVLCKVPDWAETQERPTAPPSDGRGTSRLSASPVRLSRTSAAPAQFAAYSESCVGRVRGSGQVCLILATVDCCCWLRA